MINKRKLYLGFSLVLLSGITAVSTTFAWFTTTKTASIRFTDATIRNRSANLLVEYVDSLNTMAVSETVDNFGDTKIDLTINETTPEGRYVTDISGDGVNFNKLFWSSDRNFNSERLDGVSYTKAGEIHPIILEETADANSYLIDFTLKIYRDNLSSDHGLFVYLGEATRILPKIENPALFSDTFDEDGNLISAHTNYVLQQLKNIKSTKSARLAVNNVNENLENHENILIYAQEPENKSFNPQYIYISEEQGQSAYGFDGFKINALEDVRTGHVNEVYSPNSQQGLLVTIEGDGINKAPRYFDFVSGFKYYQNKAQVDQIVLDDNDIALPDWQQPLNYGLIADLSTGNNIEAYINFRLWIEGTDSDAMTDIVGGVFTLELDIYTVEVLKN